ncbi:MAG: DUF2785 domain-containing protein [Lactobacillus sp.]|jgi:hypothetical protein|uniref:DUF2785 domain-containing protein n=1 Tax=Lacticaseibacillus suilingensis TaxID=2799577 RepID=A0ABW4BDE6_9LACO|nr:DUF2785 domain-containing protein [Lacticaseibacillus suilingensis]MCI1893265.1 DUF2785 domain-containing protein [Lactobacillus sp.]MCI1918037.1 DUF2785 domain-containing protein [Lactobacillus sp.]MCI1940785.1 DUF2785 domain-containing protein [Lactobacillus sp.]MCI1971164.1 DUF2785 domain-containing protein [Lactobacillus sp.]MCI2016397.1 DUF2785 domain-containing protein [Lactobacillus sp.]
MQNELDQLLAQPNPLSFTDAQIQWLLAHIGDPDGAIRDGLTYTLLARGFMAGGFTGAQKQAIARQTMGNEVLFAGQGLESDLIFTRSFTALLGALILSADAESTFLTDEQRQVWFAQALKYLPSETDRRGYVPGHGWAHAIAHGSDFLDAAVQHPAFPAVELGAAAQAVSTVLLATTAAFTDDEEERLAVVWCSIAKRPGGEALVIGQLQACSQQVWTSYKQAPAAVQYYYRVSTFKRVCEALFFLDSSLKAAAQDEIDLYFKQMGFLD